MYKACILSPALEPGWGRGRYSERQRQKETKQAFLKAVHTVTNDPETLHSVCVHDTYREAELAPGILALQCW